MAAEPYSRQQRRVVVDAIDGVEHRLSALDSLLSFDRSADLQLTDNNDLLTILLLKNNYVFKYKHF